MASSGSCTLKCVPEPNHLGGHPAIVVAAYACAFLPLAVIYALDFITEEWKSISATRRNGLIHMFVSLPPLAFVIFYIHLQRRMGDYKEMSAGITVAVLCIFHVLRTIWGLVQLKEFKRWNMHALRCLRRMRYDDSYLIETTIENRMQVNSSLLDNEFRNAALPAKWDHKSFLRQLCKEPFKALSFSSHMRCTLPVECSVHWMVSFLSQFGSKWLMDTRYLSKNEHGRDVEWDRRDLTKLRVLSVLHITDTALDSRSDHVSLLPFDHLFFSNPMESQNAKLEIGTKCPLPYGFRRAPDDPDFIDFKVYESTILDASTSWDKKSLNKLAQEERKVVTAITPCQLACFSKLLEQTLPLKFEFYEDVCMEKGDPRVDTFLEQLAYGPEADLRNVLEALPIRSESIGCFLWDNEYRNDFLLQASVHVDNWISLESGADMKVLNTTLERRNCSLREQTPAFEFNLQKEIEMRRLQFKTSETERSSALSLETARFLGCVTEAVRSFLSSWISLREIDPSIWEFQGLLETVRMHCSNQLTTALHAHEEHTEREKDRRERSLLMRLLWEIQSSLHNEITESLDRYRLENQDQYLSSSVPLMMLCILGYPSISIDTTEDELRFEESSHEVSSRAHQHKDDEVLRCYKISPVEGPQKLHILLEIRSSGLSRLQFHGGSRMTPELRFDWQLWKDAFIGRLTAQSEWRASRLGSDSEMLRREASYSNISNALVRKGEEETGFDYGLTFWSGWPPHLSQISHFELTVSPNLLIAEFGGVSHANRKSATRRLEEALNAHFAYHETATPGLSAQGGVPFPDEQGLLEGTAYRNSDIAVADTDGVWELSTPEMNDAVRRNESLLAVYGLGTNPLSHLYLGLCYLRTFYLFGTAFHQLLAANHFKSFALRRREHPVALTIGLLFEHGSFPSQSDERLQILRGVLEPLENQPACEQLKTLLERYIIEDSSTQQRNTVAIGILKNRNTAAAIYEDILKSFKNDVTHFASNRLGMLQLRYRIREHTASAEYLFERAEGEGNTDALCNMAVLQETQGNRDAAIDLLKDERLKSHSTALNNLAVMYEFETCASVDTALVKYLYEKAIEEDQNPVAKFNLAMLLKSEGDSSRANDILQDLHSQRQHFARMEVLLRETDKARAPHIQEAYAPLRKELEEIGDSLAFVKTK